MECSDVADTLYPGMINKNKAEIKNGRNRLILLIKTRTKGIFTVKNKMYEERMPLYINFTSDNKRIKTAWKINCCYILDEFFESFRILHTLLAKTFFEKIIFGFIIQTAVSLWHFKIWIHHHHPPIKCLSVNF